jgi:hypothetical protein
VGNKVNSKLNISDKEKYPEMDIFKSNCSGKVVSIKHPFYPFQLMSVIQRVENQKLYFKVTDNLLSLNVFLGDRLTCSICYEDYDYVFNGIIGNINYEKSKEIELCISNVNKYKSYSKCKRYIVSFPACLTIDNYNFYSTVKRLSKSSFSICCNENIKIGDELYAEIHVDNEILLQSKAEVVRYTVNDDYNDYEAKFIDINFINKIKLQNIMLRLEESESSFVAKALR